MSEMSRAQHAAQREMVLRSLLVAPTRTERGEERRRPPRPRPVVFVPDVRLHVFRLPVVNEMEI